MATVLIVLSGLGIFASIGALVIFSVLRLLFFIRRKNDEVKQIKKLVIISLISFGVCLLTFITVLIVGPKLDPVGFCEHDYHTVDIQESTCTSSGYVKKVCSLCRNEVTETIDAGHKWVQESVIEATCLHPKQIVKRCSTCSAVETIEEGSATSHSFGEYTTVTEATCFRPKQIARSCYLCGMVETVEEGATKPHSFGDWRIIVEATITEEGKQARECEECHYIEYRSIEKINYIKVTANELWDDFNANEVAAEQKYKGKTVRITGVISDINSSSTFSSANILIKVDGYGSFLGCIQCNFNSKNATALANLSKGESVTVEGTCGKIATYNLMISGCRIIE